jgi:hypothetical protein
VAAVGDSKVELLTGPFAMRDSGHYDLLAKYDSTEPEFDPNELATIFEILNLKPLNSVEAKLQEYSVEGCKTCL